MDRKHWETAMVMMPPNQSELLYHTLKSVSEASGMEVKRLKMPGGGHGDAKSVKARIKAAMKGFLANYIVC